jgi:hypothetical protein
MSAEIDYAEWYDRVDARLRELEREEAKLRPLRAFLAPLADREGSAEGGPVGTSLPELAPTNREPAEYQSQAEVTGGQDQQESQTASPSTPPSTNGVGSPADYRNMTSFDAVLHYMRSDGQPKKTPEIANALRAGGFPSKSSHFANNVYSTMRRLLERGDVERIGEGLWQLTPQGLTSGAEG